MVAISQSKYHAVAADRDNPAMSLGSQTAREKALVSWIVDHVEAGIDHRDTNFLNKWDEYYRLWRGIWSSEDKNRKSERSKLIAPALQQAIENTVAEMEEAIFGKDQWFDLDDNIDDEQKEDMFRLRDQLKQDIDMAEVPSEISKAILIGALYGTGIGVINVERYLERVVNPKQVAPGVTVPEAEEEPRFRVTLEAVDPRELSVDPAAVDVENALYVARVVNRPRHGIREKQLDGIYKNTPLGTYPDDDSLDEVTPAHENFQSNDEKTKIIEYYGKVPKSLLGEELEDGEEYEEINFEDTEEESEKKNIQYELKAAEASEMVEAIVTIANDRVLLRANENPYLMKDRPVIVYQHDTVPNQFWGRGIAEKGYNPQKALDAELRARIDSMALATYPMMAMDATRIPRGQDMNVSPGKVIVTNGNPSETFFPFTFARDIGQNTFHQSGELERMVQMGTGAMDSAAPISQNPRNNTSSGMSQINAQAIKRSKRSLQNFSRQFLQPLVKKIAWRYMQFDPRRYPIADYNFKVVATMGIMAREYEQAQLTQLLSVVPPESPAFAVLLQGIFENSSMPNKGQMMKALDQTFSPDPKQQQMQQQAKMLEMQQMAADLQKTYMETREMEADIIKTLKEAENTDDQIDVNRLRAQLEAVRTLGEIAKIDIETMKMQNEERSNNESD